ncbi:MAG TPA: hypothetical protein VK501_10605 [Baekduia sp.]|uniref:hypothetical protein n=1 Tax=Baekduia sp. TaxID=2600305 RepID=UPI002C36285D|nr:hypothetical protein [Baekduia sp.]HMJ34357.1 hypothetical protein [Baekduia sp.]
MRPTSPELDDLFLELGRGVSGVSRDVEGDQLMAPAYATPFDDLEPFTVLRPEEIGRRLGVTARSVRRAIARGELKASRACGLLLVLAADAAEWWTAKAVVRVEPERSESRPPPRPAPQAVSSPLRSSRLARGSADRLPLPPRGGGA